MTTLYPAIPVSTATRLTASGVLASLSGLTYSLGKPLFVQAMGGPGKNSLRFAPSFAAAFLNSLRATRLPLETANAVRFQRRESA